TVMIRPSNATIVVGLAVALAMAPPAKPRELLLPLVAFAVAFSIAPLWQLHENAIHLGGPFASGYAWWVPEAYGSLGKTFNESYLFGPTLPRNPHGNVIIYATALLGIDGLLGAPGDSRYLLYPFAVAVFAVIGIVAILRGEQPAPAKRMVWFGLGFLAALTI